MFFECIARYWPKIGNFFHSPLILSPHSGCNPSNFATVFGSKKIRVMGLPDQEESLTISYGHFDT